VILAIAGGCDFEHGQLQAVPDGAIDAPPDTPAPLQLRIEAWMDGRSQLVFTGHSVHWHHYQYAAPGRELFVNKPTLFDGVEWYPTWPDVPDAENRDCNCDSSTYDQLPITVPLTPTIASVTPIQVRKPPSVIQQASDANGFTLIVELTDVGASGSSDDIVDLTIAYP
jgi:hypothetical protein